MCSMAKCKCSNRTRISSNMVQKMVSGCMDVCANPICGDPEKLSLMAPLIYDEIGINLCATFDLGVDIAETYPTVTGASIKAIDAMPGATVLIGGGYDKDADFTEWVSHFPGKVRKLVLIGQTAEKIAKTCDSIGFTDYCFAEDMPQAVKICAETAKDGDCCLLSPACASWGMFKCYQQRGDIFKELVNKIEE